MLDFLLSVYLTSSALALCTSIICLGRFKRIIQDYELDMYLGFFSIVILITLSFIPIVNLYVGASIFGIGVIGSDKGIIKLLSGKDYEEGDK